MKKLLNNKNFGAAAGLILAFITIAWPFQYLKYLILKAVMPFQVSLGYSHIMPSVVLQNQQFSDVKTLLWTAMIPYLLTIPAIELFSFLIKRFDRQPVRSILLFTQFSFCTFLIFSLVFFMLDFVFTAGINSDWIQMQKLLGWGLQKRALVSLLVLFIVFSYLSLVLARLKNHFTDHHEQLQQRKFHEKIRK